MSAGFLPVRPENPGMFDGGGDTRYNACMDKLRQALRHGFLPLVLCVSLAAPVAAAPAPPIPPPPSYRDSPEIRRLLHWEHFPLHVCFVPGDLTTPERTDAVRAGFDQWVHATKDFVHYQVVTKPAQAEVVVTFLPSESVPDQDGSCGHTTMTFLTLTLKSAAVSLATLGVTPTDLQATAAHEFGHALGIDGHSDDPDDLMYAVLTRSPDDGDLPAPAHAVTARDLNTLQVCYPAFVVPPPPPAPG